LHQRWFQTCKHSEQGWLTLLACPIFDDQGVLGDLWLSRCHEAVFTEQEVRLVQQVANQCAIALRQARLYAAAQTQVEALESLNQMKDDFLSTVSHELRAPVTNMKMAIQMLKFSLSQAQSLENSGAIASNTETENNNQIQKTTQYLQILESECTREINLINDLLDLQRLEAKSELLETECIDASPWLSNLLDAFQERAVMHQQQLSIEMADSLPPIESNLDALNRILTELLHNACKYTPPNERIILSVSACQDKLKLCVTNFGTEIPADDLPRIFEKFYRVTHADRWKQGGTGLGLALVKKLVEHLNGSISVMSANNQTSFTVEVPSRYSVTDRPLTVPQNPSINSQKHN
jgi:signal transduction histidine kinase